MMHQGFRSNFFNSLCKLELLFSCNIICIILKHRLRIEPFETLTGLTSMRIPRSERKKKVLQGAAQFPAQ